VDKKEEGGGERGGRNPRFNKHKGVQKGRKDRKIGKSVNRPRKNSLKGFPSGKTPELGGKPGHKQKRKATKRGQGHRNSINFPKKNKTGKNKEGTMGQKKGKTGTTGTKTNGRMGEKKQAGQLSKWTSTKRGGRR